MVEFRAQAISHSLPANVATAADDPFRNCVTANAARRPGYSAPNM
jgi:hypothetical protein